MPMDFIYQNILLIALVVVSGVALVLPMLMGSGANEVNPAAATLLINREDARIIDVRDAEEFAGGHMPDAINIPVAKLAERLAELEKFKDKPLIVCCAAGMRSSRTPAAGRPAPWVVRAHIRRTRSVTSSSVYSRLRNTFTPCRRPALPARPGPPG